MQSRENCVSATPDCFYRKEYTNLKVNSQMSYSFIENCFIKFLCSNDTLFKIYDEQIF